MSDYNNTQHSTMGKQSDIMINSDIPDLSWLFPFRGGKNRTVAKSVLQRGRGGEMNWKKE